MEELKKLARAWKLHERRNFWKLHSTKDTMVAALMQYLADNDKSLNPVRAQKEVESKIRQPAPPVSSKPSSSAAMSNMRNYCGIPFYFNKECTPRELISSSRYVRPPKPDDSVSNLIDNWRASNFNIGNDTDNQNNPDPSSSNAVDGDSEGGDAEIDAQTKLQKHRNLSVHLVQYSASVDAQKDALTSKSVQVFLTVAESTDPQTVCNCIIAISNICSSPAARAILLEMNAIHKLAAMIPLIRGPKALWAAGLLFYYFSLEKDIEDRIYNASFALLKNNGSSEDYGLRMLSLYTLNNLLPCIERQRVTELIISTISPFFAACDGVILKEHYIILDILTNVCYFTNTHNTLMDLDVLDMLSMLAAAAASSQDESIGRKIVKILGTFMNSPDLAEQLTAADYVSIFIDLLSIRDTEIVAGSLCILAVMSSMESLTDCVCDTDVVQVVCNVIADMTISTEAAIEAGKYFANICQSRVEEYSQRLLKDGAAHAIIRLIQAPYPPELVAANALKGLQNMLAHNANCVALVEEVWKPLVHLISEHSLVDAGYCLYNVACSRECEIVLVNHRIHSQILGYMGNTKDSRSRSSFVQILVQLANNKQCVEDLLEENVIEKSMESVKAVLSVSKSTANYTSNVSLWIDISQMLLALVANKQDMLETHCTGIVKILTLICTSAAEEQVVNNCAKILAYLSLNLTSFQQIDPVIGTILSLSDNDIVMESISIVLYNVTCSPEHSLKLLENGKYLNIMIRMMRSGKSTAQENIANGMRTLCSIPRCTGLLLDLDLLSDFIVIALLRTSSEAIKSVCAESFFNMLCHPDYRQKLLRGDLWWAMMRLSRSNHLRVRLICAKTLFNLACDPKNMQPLRDNNVLALVKEISSTGSPDFLEICLQAVQNIVSQFENNLTETEVLSVLRLCTDVLARCDGLNSRSSALQLLVRCAQQCTDEAIVEFVTVDIANVINVTRSKWCDEKECCNSIASLTRSVTRNPDYTKATPLADIEETLQSLLYKGAPLDVFENVTATVARYVFRGNIQPHNLVTLSVWKHICEQNVFGSAAVDENRTSHKLKVMTASIVAYVFEFLLENPSIGTQIPLEMLGDMLKTSELMVDPLTRENMKFIIFKCSLYEATAEVMLRSGVCSMLILLLSKYVVSDDSLDDHGYLSFAEQAQMKQNKLDQSNERGAIIMYSAAVLKNISLIPELLPLMVKATDIDKLVDILAKSKLNAIAMDLATVLFFTCRNKQLNHTSPLSPKLVLETVTALDGFEIPPEVDNTPVVDMAMVTRVTKHIIGIVLDEYSMGAGVHPSFIQSMYSEIQDRTSADIPMHMEALRPVTALDSICVTMPSDVISEQPVIVYAPFIEQETQWNTIEDRIKKEIRSDFYSRSTADPVISEEVLTVDLPEMSECNKMNKSYSLVTLDE